MADRGVVRNGSRAASSSMPAGPARTRGTARARPDIGVLRRAPRLFRPARCRSAVFQDFIRTLAPIDCARRKYSVLVVIAANPGLSQADVAAALGIERARLVHLLDRLEKRGLTRGLASSHRPPLACARAHAPRAGIRCSGPRCSPPGTRRASPTARGRAAPGDARGPAPVRAVMRPVTEGRFRPDPAIPLAGAVAGRCEGACGDGEVPMAERLPLPGLVQSRIARATAQPGGRPRTARRGRG